MKTNRLLYLGLLLALCTMAQAQTTVKLTTSTAPEPGIGSGSGVFLGVSAAHDAFGGAYATDGNTFLGAGSGYHTFRNTASSSPMQGSYNTFAGAGSAFANTFGSYNAAFGNGALSANTTGDFSSAFGFNALGLNSGSGNTAFGYRALYYGSGSGNLAIGGSALGNPSSTAFTGSNNAGIGTATGTSLTSGSLNLMVGISSGLGLQTGNSNVFLGTVWVSNPALSNTIILADNSNNTNGQRVYINGTGMGVRLGDNIAPVHGLDIRGNVAVGSATYTTSTAATLTNGMIVEGRIGVGTLDPQKKLDIYSEADNTSGLRFSRLNALAPSGAVVAPTGRVLTLNDTGDVVLTTDQNDGGTGPATAWNLLGNASTNAAIHFVGTTDDVNLMFRRKNIRAGHISPTTVALGVNKSLISPFGEGPNIGSTNSVYIGVNAGNATDAASTQNTYVGAFAGGGSPGIASANTFVGFSTGIGNAGGDENTYVGFMAGADSSTGSVNTFVGRSSGRGMVSGTYNTFLGTVMMPPTVATSSMAGKDTSNTIILASGNNSGPNASDMLAGQKQRLYIHSNGNTGINLGNNVIPQNPMDINGTTVIGNNTYTGVAATAPAHSLVVQGSVGIGTNAPSTKVHIVANTADTSGLRLASLTDSSPTSGDASKFLTVDNTGNVVLKTVTGGGTGSGLTLYTGDSDIINTLTSGPDAQVRIVNMNGNNIFFKSEEEDVHGRIYIGASHTFPTTLPAAEDNYRLFVEGGVLTEKVKVALRNPATEWPDYVFATDYQLMPLDKVESYVKENKHLPGMDSAEELGKKGLDLGDMQRKQLEKIEELTLHLIEQNKTIEKQNKELEILKVQMQSLMDKK
jgi:hypothetical protein